MPDISGIVEIVKNGAVSIITADGKIITLPIDIITNNLKQGDKIILTITKQNAESPADPVSILNDILDINNNA